MPVSYSESFDKANGAGLGPDLSWIGAGWSTIDGGWADTVGGNIAVADVDLPDNQYAEVVVDNHIGDPSRGWRWSGPVVRSDGFAGYQFVLNWYVPDIPDPPPPVYAAIIFGLNIGGTLDVAVAISEPTPPFTLRIEAEGRHLRGYVDGTLTVSATDTTLTAGKAGIQGPYGRFNDFAAGEMPPATTAVASTAGSDTTVTAEAGGWDRTIRSAVDVTTTADTDPVLDGAVSTPEMATAVTAVAIWPPRTFHLAPAIRGPVAFGARVHVDGVDVPRIAAYLFHRSDLRHPIATLDRSFNRGWQDILNEAGSGNLTLGNEDPDAALIDAESVIRFEDDGWAAFCMLVRDIERHVIDPGEEHGQVTKASGPGHIAILEEAVVYPSRGVAKFPIEEDRLFNWTAFDYFDAWWSQARNLAGVYDITPAWYGMRDGWPVGSPAEWIGPSMGTPSLAPGGTCYYRRYFLVEDLAAGAPLTVTVYLVADDTSDLYVDGQHLLSAGQWGNTPSDVYTQQLEVDPGFHILAVSVNNSEVGPAIIGGEPFNPTGLVVAVHYNNPDGTVSATPVVSTDSSWRIVEYPPGPPGMTPGEVIIHVVTEAQARGALPTVGFAFTEETDSAGNPWPLTADISTKVGYDLWTFFKELVQTYVDLWMEPGSFTLWAWNKGTRGAHRSVPFVTAPTSAATGNIVNLTHHTTT